MAIHTLRKHTTATAATPAVSDRCEIQFVDELKVRRAARALAPASAVVALAETFKLLGDPTRLKIVLALSREELCVCDLAWIIERADNLVSHHARALRAAGLAEFRRDGKLALYSLTPRGLALLDTATAPALPT